MMDLSMVANIGVMLLVTLSLIVIVGYFSKKYKIFTPASGQGVALIGGTAIGKNSKLVLIEVLDKKILLGVSEQQINTLCVFDHETGMSSSGLKDSINE